MIGANNVLYDQINLYIIVFFLIIFLFLTVLSSIVNWFIFEKAGESGWKALIPFYNSYTSCYLFLDFGWWFIVPIGLTVLSAIPVVNILAALARIVYSAWYCSRKARCFDKSGLFAVGLFFLDPFMSISLAFGKSDYTPI